MTRILVVEDEEHLAQGLRFNLEAEGYDVATAESGERGLAEIHASPFDVILMDVMLPGKDGFQVVRELRAAGNFTPTMMLTARGQAEDVLRGFESGADDYLPKPFDLSILQARIQGLLRRREWLQKETDETTAPTQEVRIGARVVDFETQQIMWDDQAQQLTVMEADLLRYLVQAEGKPVSRKALLEEVWGVREDTDTRAVDNFIVRLRRYIEPDPSKPRFLLTVRGLGYQLRMDE